MSFAIETSGFCISPHKPHGEIIPSKTTPNTQPLISNTIISGELHVPGEYHPDFGHARESRLG